MLLPLLSLPGGAPSLTPHSCQPQPHPQMSAPSRLTVDMVFAEEKQIVQHPVWRPDCETLDMHQRPTAPVATDQH